MKALKRTTRQFLALIIASTMLLGTMIIASAAECSHPAFDTYSTVTIDCISTGSHPCYVGGELKSCETYVYKFLNYEKCVRCGYQRSYYSYGSTLHQYIH